MKTTKYLITALLAVAACSQPEAAGPADKHAQTLVDGDITYRAETIVHPAKPVAARGGW